MHFMQSLSLLNMPVIASVGVAIGPMPDVTLGHAQHGHELMEREPPKGVCWLISRIGVSRRWIP